MTAPRFADDLRRLADSGLSSAYLDELVARPPQSFSTDAWTPTEAVKCFAAGVVFGLILLGICLLVAA